MFEPPVKFHVAIWLVFSREISFTSGCLMFILLLLSGGGIGGLTLAFALSKSSDISVDVYEAASKFTEIGAGITLWWRTRQVLKSLGLEEDVIRLLTVPPGQDRGELRDAAAVRDSEVLIVPSIRYRKANKPEGLAMGAMYSRGLIIIFRSPWSTQWAPHESFPSPFRPGELMGLHRAEFHAVLLNHLPSRCRTSSSKRLESYVQQPGAPIMLHFQDGSTATCDILIGADGLKSAVRKTMFQEAAILAESQHRNADAAELGNLSEPRFSGVFCYRTLIPGARLLSISPQHRIFSSPVQVRCSLLIVSKNSIIIVFYRIQYLGENRVSSITQRRSAIIPDLRLLISLAHDGVSNCSRPLRQPFRFRIPSS
jgi:salicylate hydroxylase